MIRRYGIETGPDHEGPKLIRKKNKEEKPISYPPRYRTMLIITSLFLAFVLGLFIMPSKMKRDALEKTSQQQRAMKEYKEKAERSPY